MRYVFAAVTACLAVGLSAGVVQAAQKHKSPAEMAEAARDLSEKADKCRSEAKQQKLHLSKRRAFMRGCIKAQP